ncbi:MAG: TolC family protein [Bryobacterales bacterium]|nr:TolC family protein [Bryobacterales bacterium]
MLRNGYVLVLAACAASGQVRTLTLKEAVELASARNPEVAMARLDERKAEQAVRVARDPFAPKLTAGSGLAYSSGIPMSVGGATPSIVQAQASQFVWNRQQSHLVAQAREDARGAAIGTAARRDEVVRRTAVAYLDAERAARLAETARKQVESLERIAQTVTVRVSEGRELPVEAKRASLSLARARQRLESLEADREYAESLLGVLAGLDAGQRIRVALEERAPAPLPPGEDAAAASALSASTEVRRLESELAAKGFEIQAQKAAKLPRVDLVAQYALLGKFNNYEDFFRKFQRHNTQIGVSFQVPLFTGPAVDAQRFQAESDAARLRLELQAVRNRIAVDARRLYQQVRQAESAREVARLDLELARDQVSLLLARMEEGRASLGQVEEGRVAENEKWLALIDAAYALETARVNLLAHTGDLLAALR